MDQLVVLLHVCPLLLEDALVDLEDLVWLTAELELLELEGGFNQHKDWHLGLEREPISRQVVAVDGLFELADLLGAE